MCARVMPIRSTAPEVMAWRAVATSLTRAACITGSFTSRFTSRARSRCGPAGVPMPGMTWEIDSSEPI